MTMRQGWMVAGIAALLAMAAPAQAVSIRELAQYEQPVLVAHIMGSVAGAAAGLKLAGNQAAVDCVHRWAMPPSGGNGDPQALTDILTRIADQLGRLQAGGKAPDYEDLLAAALRKQCGAALPSHP
jgi:hypothetical protein